MSNTVANTILQQLGGTQFVMLTGSKHFTGSDNALSFHVGRNDKRISGCRVVLEANDTYTVSFFKGMREASKHEGIYCDQLQDLFEEQTALYVTFRPRG